MACTQMQVTSAVCPARAQLLTTSTSLRSCSECKTTFSAISSGVSTKTLPAGMAGFLVSMMSITMMRSYSLNQGSRPMPMVPASSTGMRPSSTELTSSSLNIDMIVSTWAWSK